MFAMVKNWIYPQKTMRSQTAVSQQMTTPVVDPFQKDPRTKGIYLLNQILNPEAGAYLFVNMNDSKQKENLNTVINSVQMFLENQIEIKIETLGLLAGLLARGSELSKSVQPHDVIQAITFYLNPKNELPPEMNSDCRVEDLKKYLGISAENQSKSALRQQVQWNVLISKFNENKDLSNLDLSSMDLSHLNFSRVRFVNVNLTGADLTETNLNSADMSGSKLQGATLFRTNLRMTNLKGADIEKSDLAGAIKTEHTKLGRTTKQEGARRATERDFL